jgi:hypothetical protein
MWLYDPVAAAAIARRSMRNLHLFLASDTEHSIGGLHVNGGLTNKVFLDILENILLVGEPFTVEREGFGNVGRDDDRTRSGRYIIHGKLHPHA